MLHQIILIFIAGIIVDLFATRYTHAVAEKKLWQATLLSGCITLSTFVLLTVIIKESAMGSLVNIMAYAGGNTLGTFLALKRS